MIEMHIITFEESGPLSIFIISVSINSFHPFCMLLFQKQKIYWRGGGGRESNITFLNQSVLTTLMAIVADDMISQNDKMKKTHKFKQS